MKRSWGTDDVVADVVVVVELDRPVRQPVETRGDESPAVGPEPDGFRAACLQPGKIGAGGRVNQARTPALPDRQQVVARVEIDAQGQAAPLAGIGDGLPELGPPSNLPEDRMGAIHAHAEKALPVRAERLRVLGAGE